jgi:hypothetical protein
MAIRFGSRLADPQGAAGTFRYTIQIFRNGRAYELVILREADQTVFTLFVQVSMVFGLLPNKLQYIQ